MSLSEMRTWGGCDKEWMEVSREMDLWIDLTIRIEAKFVETWEFQTFPLLQLYREHRS
jgi:hypothetical protein